jgi:hypothetical protein
MTHWRVFTSAKFQILGLNLKRTVPDESYRTQSLAGHWSFGVFRSFSPHRSLAVSQ